MFVVILACCSPCVVAYYCVLLFRSQRLTSTEMVIMLSAISPTDCFVFSSLIVNDLSTLVSTYILHFVCDL